MKKALLLMLLVCSINVFAQDTTAAKGDTTVKVDTTVKKDTVMVPLFEVSDTVKAGFSYVDAKGFVRYTNGFVIRKGFAARTERGMQWAEEPKPSAIVDEKFRPLKNLLQIH